MTILSRIAGRIVVDPLEENRPIEQHGPRQAIEQIVQNIAGSVGTPIRGDQKGASVVVGVLL